MGLNSREYIFFCKSLFSPVADINSFQSMGLKAVLCLAVILSCGLRLTCEIVYFSYNFNYKYGQFICPVGCSTYY